MNDNKYSSVFFSGCLVGLLIGLFLIILSAEIVVIPARRKEWEQEAVQQNIAEYKVDNKTGEVTFEFKKVNNE